MRCDCIFVFPSYIRIKQQQRRSYSYTGRHSLKWGHILLVLNRRWYIMSERANIFLMDRYAYASINVHTTIRTLLYVWNYVAGSERNAFAEDYLRAIMFAISISKKFHTLTYTALIRTKCNINTTGTSSRNTTVLEFYGKHFISRCCQWEFCLRISETYESILKYF